MKTAIIINSDALGKGDEELGKKLIGAFLRKLWVQTELPEMIVCYHSGVKLVALGSPVLDVLHGLYEKGVEIVACGTCMEYYELDQHIEVGRITDMVEIVSIMMGFEKVITI